jgi:signal transduction histidine kinase
MPSRSPSRWVVLAGSAVIGLKVVVSAPQLPGQAAVVAITWLISLSFVVIGLTLLATEVPPANGWGCILVALATVPGDLNDPSYTGSVLSAVGFVLEPLYLLAASALVLRYPKARLNVQERLLLGCLLGVGLISRVAQALTSGPLPDDFFRPRGWSAASVAPVWHDEVFVRAGRSITALLLIVVAVVLAGRLRRAHGLSRQSQAPLVVIGLVCALAAAADQLVWVVGTPAARDLPAALVRNLSAALLPVAILADLLRRKAAGAAVSNRILTAALSGSIPELQQAVREVFVDRSATVEIPDGRGGWLDTNARPVREETDPPGRRLEVVHLEDGDTLLRIGLDPRAVQDETLVSAAVAAVRVGTHNTRLRTDLLAALSEVGNSRTRIVEAGLAERRRVERNLHDGAQQQFLAVAATLAQSDLVDDDHLREVLSGARATLSDALAELRNLARGIHPAILSQGGLAAALPPLCGRMPWPVDLTVDPRTAQLPEAVEAAAYFLIAELLTNAARHAQASGASVRVTVNGGMLHVRVADDGIGGATIVAGGGIEGLRDRVHALGGTLLCEGVPPGRGTSVSATLPMTAKGAT